MTDGVESAERFEYAVALERASEGGCVITCRDLPALVTQGDDREDALAQAADAMDEVFATMMKLGLDFPVPTSARRGERLVSPPVEAVAKAALYVALRDANVTGAADFEINGFTLLASTQCFY